MTECNQKSVQFLSLESIKSQQTLMAALGHGLIYQNNSLSSLIRSSKSSASFNMPSRHGIVSVGLSSRPSTSNRKPTHDLSLLTFLAGYSISMMRFIVICRIAYGFCTLQRQPHSGGQTESGQSKPDSG